MAGSLSLAEKLAKSFSEVTISNLGEMEDYVGLPTGFPQLDGLLGNLGIPKGKATQLAGPEGSGKSTLAAQIVANVQKAGGKCFYIDVEQTLNPSYCTSLGVNVDELMVAQPMYGEDALGLVEAIAEDGSVDLVVFDSVGQLIVKREFEGDLTDADVGIRAKVLGKAVRRIAPVANRTGTSVLYINQLRDNVGAMGYAKKTMSPGGRTYKHDLALELDIVRTTAIKAGEDEIGFNAKLTVVKSKLSASRQSVDLPFYYGEGFDQVACILQDAISRGVLKSSGPWIKWAETGESFAQGFERARQKLKDEPELLATLTT